MKKKKILRNRVFARTTNGLETCSSECKQNIKQQSPRNYKMQYKRDSHFYSKLSLTARGGGETTKFLHFM